jgi:hypothetical protein
MWGLEEGGAVAVANDREDGEEVVNGKKTLNGDDQTWPFRQRKRGTVAAMFELQGERRQRVQRMQANVEKFEISSAWRHLRYST